MLAGEVLHYKYDADLWRRVMRAVLGTKKGNVVTVAVITVIPRIYGFTHLLPKFVLFSNFKPNYLS